VSRAVWERFLKAVQAGALLRPGEAVVVGVSGGPDSLALLHLLCRLRDEPAWAVRPIAAHLNHSLRPEAGEDAAFVRQTAQSWGVEIVERVVDVPALSRQTRLSIEEAARAARYRFLGETALAYGAPAVAVAHHADDQVESVLMHWLRGAGLAGLRGMLPSAPLAGLRLDEPAANARLAGVRLIRPLLGCRREELLAYCEAHGLQPRWDRSNLDTTIYRNRLRHELIPYLETYNPNLRAVVARSATALARDYDYLHGQVMAAWAGLAQEPADGVVQLDLARWRALHPSLQAGVLREAVRRLRWSLRDINWVHIEDAAEVARAGHTGQRATLPQGLMLTLGYRSIWIAPAGWQPSEGDWPALEGDAVAVPVPGSVKISGWTLTAELAEAAEVAGAALSNADPWTAYLDAERLQQGALCLRRRRPGDWLRPLGMGGRRKDVRQLFIAARVPQAARERYPLLAAGEDLAWIPGVRADERFAVRPDTKQVVIFALRAGA
jgi:tRNA(Ile)-lysidine synthase